MLEAGRPKEVFEADGLHMNPEALHLTLLVRPVLEAESRAVALPAAYARPSLR